MLDRREIPKRCVRKRPFELSADKHNSKSQMEVLKLNSVAKFLPVKEKEEKKTFSNFLRIGAIFRGLYRAGKLYQLISDCATILKSSLF